MEKIKFKASKLAEMINGQLVGEDIDISGLCSIDDIKSGSIVPLFSSKAFKQNDCSGASIFVMQENENIETDKPLIKVKDPKLAFLQLIDIFFPEENKEPGIESGAYVHESAKIMDEVYIGHNVIIEADTVIESGVVIEAGTVVKKGSVIGSGSHIYPNVTIYHDSEIGRNVIIHSGAVIGADGFGFHQVKGSHVKIRQVGNVVLGDNVEIGSMTTIDRGVLGSTVIGDGTKTDNHVHIAHNCKIGKNCIFVAYTGISGSCEIGDNCIFAARTGVADHVKIVSGTVLLAGCGAIKDIKEPGMYLGVPAMPRAEFAKNNAVFSKLYDLKKQVDRLRKRADDGDGC